MTYMVRNEIVAKEVPWKLCWTTEMALDMFREACLVSARAIIVDMDGVDVDYVDCDTRNPGWRERSEARGYYRNLPPIEEGVAFIRRLIAAVGSRFVFICTAAPTAHAMQEKKDWIAQHIPELDQSHIIPVFLGESKVKKMWEVLPTFGFAPAKAILLDDYGKNLAAWHEANAAAATEEELTITVDGIEVSFTGVKVYNGHNCRGQRPHQECPILCLRSQAKGDADWARHIAAGVV